MYHFNFLYWESAGDDLHFCLTENVFVSPSFLKGIFSGCRARLWLLFSFSSLILLPLAPGSHYRCWETSFSLIVVSLNVSILYFLAYFQIFFFFRVLQFHYDVFWWGFLFIDPAWDSLGFRKCELGLPSVLEYTHEHLSACCFLPPFSPSPPSVLLYLRWTSHCNFQVS